jgi:hypothetical protein
MNNLPSINISTRYRRPSIPLVYNTQRQYSGALLIPTYIKERSTEDKERKVRTVEQGTQYQRMNHRKTVLKLRTIPSHLA